MENISFHVDKINLRNVSFLGEREPHLSGLPKRSCLVAAPVGRYPNCSNFPGKEREKVVEEEKEKTADRKRRERRRDRERNAIWEAGRNETNLERKPRKFRQEKWTVNWENENEESFSDTKRYAIEMERYAPCKAVCNENGTIWTIFLSFVFY